jgi:hypothetical protein
MKDVVYMASFGRRTAIGGYPDDRPLANDTQGRSAIAYLSLTELRLRQALSSATQARSCEGAIEYVPFGGSTTLGPSAAIVLL